MTRCGPRSLCQIVRNTYVSTKYPDQKPHPEPNQVAIPATSLPQPDQVQMPPEPELMEVDIPEDTPNLIDVPEEILSGFDTWSHSVLDYQW